MANAEVIGAVWGVPNTEVGCCCCCTCGCCCWFPNADVGGVWAKADTGFAGRPNADCGADGVLGLCMNADVGVVWTGVPKADCIVPLCDADKSVVFCGPNADATGAGVPNTDAPAGGWAKAEPEAAGVDVGTAKAEGCDAYAANPPVLPDAAPVPALANAPDAGLMRDDEGDEPKAEVTGAGCPKADCTGAAVPNTDVCAGCTGGGGCANAETTGPVAGVPNTEATGPGAGFPKAEATGAGLPKADVTGAGFPKADVGCAGCANADATGAGVPNTDVCVGGANADVDCAGCANPDWPKTGCAKAGLPKADAVAGAPAPNAEGVPA